MHYVFPEIRNISDVLAVVEGSPYFKVVDHDWYKTVGYSAYPLFFSDDPTHQAIMRECRGLIFDSTTGAILRRPYHKFFNVGELPETQLDKLDLSLPHMVLPKLDGSMVTPLPTFYGTRWATKAGITPVSMAVEVFVASRPHYRDFVEQLYKLGITPVFEWMSPEFKIVVNHEKEALTLTGARYLFSGKYVPYWHLFGEAEHWGIPFVAPDVRSSVTTMDIINEARSLTNQEGYVIRFDDGHMVKIKCDWYLELHRIMAKTSDPRVLFGLVLEHRLDDLLCRLDGQTRARVCEYADAFWQNLAASIERLQEMVSRLVRQYDRRAYALSDEDETMKSVVFMCWDHPNNVEAIVLRHARQAMDSKERLRKFSEQFLDGLLPPKLMFGD